MLKYLLKYDLKWCFKIVSIYYIIAVFFSIVGRLLGLIESSLIFNVISSVCFGIAISMMVSALVTAIMRLWARFTNNIYKDEAYLTHTLPVKKDTILLSKVISGIIAIFASVLVIVLCLFICYYTKDNMDMLINSLNVTAETFSISPVALISLFSLAFFFQMLLILFIGYLGILVGHKSNSGRFWKSLLAGFAFYMIAQILLVVIILIVGAFSADIANLLFTTSQISGGAIIGVLSIGTILYAMIAVLVYFCSLKIFKQGVDLE